mmetsp:Transcript_5524/g.7611  ORF Transcript_5524/g.7611 Transcript_5524/m.7611 type:complete len:450 (+) Transcript_5524:148-1497(+)
MEAQDQHQSTPEDELQDDTLLQTPKASAFIRNAPTETKEPSMEAAVTPHSQSNPAPTVPTVTISHGPALTINPTPSTIQCPEKIQDHLHNSSTKPAEVASPLQNHQAAKEMCGPQPSSVTGNENTDVITMNDAPSKEPRHSPVGETVAENQQTIVKAEEDTYAAEKEAEEEAKKREPYWHPVLVSDKAKMRQKNKRKRLDVTHADLLVPIRIDAEVDGCRLVDTFMWNLNEIDLSPEQFAAELCADLDLVPRFEQLVASAIRSQLAAYVPQLPPFKDKDGEMLVPITIDVRYRSLHMRDCLEWDLCNETLTPEEFARVTCADLGLPGDYEPALALHVHEQLSDYKAALSGKRTQTLIDPSIVNIVEQVVEGTQSSQSGKPNKRRRLTVKRMPAVQPETAVRTEKEAEEWGPQISLVPASSQLQLAEALWQRYCPQPSESQKARYPSASN